jgi:hypothetical protein
VIGGPVGITEIGRRVAFAAGGLGAVIGSAGPGARPGGGRMPDRAE